MAELLCVDPARAHEVWPHVEGMIRTAIERGDLGTYEAVRNSVLVKNGLLWLVTDGNKIAACVVTELVRTEKSLSCVIVACGGTDVRDWVGLIAGIEDYARAEGCDCVRLFGRKGWARLLKDYSAPKILLEKRL